MNTQKECKCCSKYKKENEKISNGIYKKKGNAHMHMIMLTRVTSNKEVVQEKIHGTYKIYFCPSCGARLLDREKPMKGGNPKYSTYKQDAINAATELYYGKDVIEQLEKADSDSEISRIMITARRRRWYFAKNTFSIMKQ